VSIAALQFAAGRLMGYSTNTDFPAGSFVGEQLCAVGCLQSFPSLGVDG
jgi:hypothetical protein